MSDNTFFNYRERHLFSAYTSNRSGFDAFTKNEYNNTFPLSVDTDTIVPYPELLNSFQSSDGLGTITILTSGLYTIEATARFSENSATVGSRRQYITIAEGIFLQRYCDQCIKTTGYHSSTDANPVICGSITMWLNAGDVISHYVKIHGDNCDLMPTTSIELILINEA